jgi:prepilin-type N-terminal cleavage/methylation domain-containing protein
MISYTKLKKLKKLNNRRFSPSFTLIELLIVIIIIGILISSISFNLTLNKLNIAADEIIKNIRYTESLALKDDKYQPFPINSSVIEKNRSKYWFKQWWQIRFYKDSNNNYYYEIFSDIPYDKETSTYTYNFDRTAHFPNNTESWYKSIALNSNGKLLIGKCGGSTYPPCDEIDDDLNLTKTYEIKEIVFQNKNITTSKSGRLIFDNYGNIFLNEGQKSDKGDINPLDESNRNILTTLIDIKLCTILNCKEKKDIKHCVQINITPAGEIYKSKCNWTK